PWTDGRRGNAHVLCSMCHHGLPIPRALADVVTEAANGSAAAGLAKFRFHLVVNAAQHHENIYCLGRESLACGSEEPMKEFIQYILSILMTFLPPRYRDPDATLRGPAMSAGVFQFAVMLVGLLIRFAFFTWDRATSLGPFGSGTTTPSNLPEVNATFGGG